MKKQNKNEKGFVFCSFQGGTTTYPREYDRTWGCCILRHILVFNVLLRSTSTTTRPTPRTRVVSITPYYVVFYSIINYRTTLGVL